MSNFPSLSIMSHRIVRGMMTANYWYERARELPVEHPFYQRAMWYDKMSLKIAHENPNIAPDDVHKFALDAYNRAYTSGIHTVKDYGQIEYSPDYFAWHMQNL